MPKRPHPATHIISNQELLKPKKRLTLPLLAVLILLFAGIGVHTLRGSHAAGLTPIMTTAPYFCGTATGVPGCTTVTGEAVQGQVLRIGTGIWANSPTSYSYQWLRCTTTAGQPPSTGSCVAISGATASSYTVTVVDIGHSLEATVTAANSSGDSAPVSTAPSAVAAANATAETFCTNAPVTCAYPDYLSGNVGVPPGTTLTPLASASLPSGASRSGSDLIITGNNVTVSGLLINGQVTMSGSHDTLKNSQIICGDCTTAINEGSSATASTQNMVEDSTISGTAAGCNAEITNAAIGYNYMNALRVYVYWAAEGINGSDENVQDSYIYSNTFCSNPLDHTEPVNAGDGNGSDAQELIQHNTLDNPESQTAAFITGGSWGPLVNTHLINNMLIGGGYTIYCCQTNPWGVNTPPSNTSITDNRFSRKYYPNGGGYGPIADLETTYTPFTGNVWDDSCKTVNSDGSAGAVCSNSSPPNTGDLNGDGHVNIFDLSIFLSHWQQTSTGLPEDFNNDGTVNIFDLSILLSHYGT
jgi:hypothetical protein